jgi:hypothetical protein
MTKFLLMLFISTSLFSQTFNRDEWRVWKTYKRCISVREKVLINYSLVPVIMDEKKCNVINGQWKPLWQNSSFTQAKEIDVDHTVPLSWAWKHGADKWTKKMKADYANNLIDQYHLMPLSVKANRTKRDKGPDQWMPETNRCLYINTFINIVNKNKLTLSDKEKIKYDEIVNKECQN